MQTNQFSRHSVDDLPVFNVNKLPEFNLFESLLQHLPQRLLQTGLHDLISRQIGVHAIVGIGIFQAVALVLHFTVVVEIMMFLHFRGANSYQKFGMSVAGYAAARIFVEFYRVPDEHLGYLAWGWLTQGQVLSFVMFLIGVGIIGYDAVRRKRFFSTD